MTSRPIAARRGHDRATPGHWLARQAGEHPQEHQPVRHQAEHQGEQLEQPCGPVRAAQPEVPEDPPGEPPAGDRRQSVGERHGQAEPHQRGQVGPQPTQVRGRRVLVMTPLHGQGIAEVGHPPQPRDQGEHQAEHPDRGGRGDRLVDQSAQGLVHARGQCPADLGHELDEQLRVRHQHQRDRCESDHQQRHQRQQHGAGPLRHQDHRTVPAAHPQLPHLWVPRTTSPSLTSAFAASRPQRHRR